MVNYERRREREKLKGEGENVLRPEAKWSFLRFNKLLMLKHSGLARLIKEPSDFTIAPAMSHYSQIFLYLKLFNQTHKNEILFEYYWKGVWNNEELRKIRVRFYCNDIYVFNTRDISWMIKTAMFVVPPIEWRTCVAIETAPIPLLTLMYV